MENTVTLTLSRFKELEKKEKLLKELEEKNSFVKIEVGKNSWGMFIENDVRYFNIQTDNIDMRKYLKDLEEKILKEVFINNSKELDARNYRRIPNWVKKIFIK